MKGRRGFDAAGSMAASQHAAVYRTLPCGPELGPFPTATCRPEPLSFAGQGVSSTICGTACTTCAARGFVNALKEARRDPAKAAVEEGCVGDRSGIAAGGPALAA